jgi:hypothetical protein
MTYGARSEARFCNFGLDFYCGFYKRVFSGLAFACSSRRGARPIPEAEPVRT